MPNINQKLVYIKNSALHGHEIIIDPPFRAVLSAICDTLEHLSSDVSFKTRIANFRADLSFLEGKTVNDLLHFLTL